MNTIFSKFSKIGFHLQLVILACLAGVEFCNAQDAVTPGNIITNSTFQHIGVHYQIEGDDNLNSTLAITYRKEGSTDDFISGAVTMRAHPDLVVDGELLNRNYHAGSLFFLEVATDYEIRIDLEDTDGGSVVDTIIVTTRALPVPNSGGQQKYVIPGNGGGAGTEADPFLGLQAAANNADAGDIFNVQPGIYASFNCNTNGAVDNPIVFRSTPLHGAVIDGEDTSTGIVTLGVYDDSLQHIIVDGFSIKNGRWGIDAQNTQYLTIQNCVMENVDYGIVNRRANGWEHDQYIVNNSLTGNTLWPQLDGSIPGERAIDIRGNRNVVSFNFITNFGDGISTDGPPYGKSYCLDIHNNDITNIVDDALEVDGSVSNTAIYSNRCMNARMGVSLAPVLGGPCYVFRNVFYNLETSAYKMNRGPSGLVIYHNTSLKEGNGISSNAGWQNTILKNNIIIGDRYCFEEYGLVTGSTDDWDYNGYYSTRVGTSGEPWFKWDNIRYDNVLDLNTSTDIETNGLEVDLDIFDDAEIPEDYSVEYVTEDINVNLENGANVIDNGAVLDNINDIFVFDGSPDIGALEYDEPNPIYGPDFNLISNGHFDVDLNSIHIYPNPTSHFIVITGTLDNYEIRILNSQGQLFEVIQNDGDYQAIDIGHLGQGLYFIEIENLSNDAIIVKKIIKQ